jgi:crotonobetainyl-CoA:carnitine CoA-transferase CaiB-like acyl-CoA transferase
MTQPAASGAGPLDGIRVLELANFMAGPISTALMADLGAEVIKVEPPAGDPMRGQGGGNGQRRVNHGFQALNRGKRSIVVDLTKPGAAEVVLRLVTHTDVFVTNLLTARLQRFGLEFAALRTRKPDIVMAQLTGWGSAGPGAERPGFDSTAFWAGSGLMSLMGEQGSPAVVSRGGQGDYPAGLNLLAAVLAALRLRDRTGQAQFVEVTLQQTGVWSLANEMQRVLNTPDQPPQRFDRMKANLATRNAYETADGRWIMCAMHNTEYWRRFCKALGRDDWAADPRYVSPAGTPQNQTELIPAIDAIFRSRPLSYWAKQLDEHGCVWSPAATLTEVVNDPQLELLNAFPTVDTGGGASTRVVAVPFTIQAADTRPKHGAPALAADTEQVLHEAGFGAAEVATLKRSGVLG